MGIVAVIKKPKVSGVCVITRKGVLVGTLPPGATLPAKLAKIVEERKSTDEHPSEPEDPF